MSTHKKWIVWDTIEHIKKIHRNFGVRFLNEGNIAFILQDKLYTLQHLYITIFKLTSNAIYKDRRLSGHTTRHFHFDPGHLIGSTSLIPTINPVHLPPESNFTKKFFEDE